MKLIVFFRALPDKTLSGKKERLMISFDNAGGGKDPLMIIGKSATPRCIRGLRDKNNPHRLPCYSNSKAWTNADIMTTLIEN